MPTSFLNLALGLAIQVGVPAPPETPYFQPPARANNQNGFSGAAEQRYPFDTQMNWVHGYHQEIPAYGGHHVFRPYNYKDVLSQSQTAAGWGERPAMPYAQQYWHKYHDQATMLKVSATQAAPMPYMAGQPVIAQPQIWTPPPAGFTAQPTKFQMPSQQIVTPQTTIPSSTNTIALPASLSDPLQAPAIPMQDGATQINYRR